jgi:hypothetical protein
MSKNNAGVVIINLDRPRELRFTHSALKKAVALTGKSLEEIEQSGFADFELVEKLAYCALLKDARENNEQLELEDIEKLLDHVDTWADIPKALTRAFMLAFGVDPDAVDAGGNSQRPGE